MSFQFKSNPNNPSSLALSKQTSKHSKDGGDGKRKPVSLAASQHHPRGDKGGRSKERHQIVNDAHQFDERGGATIEK